MKMNGGHMNEVLKINYEAEQPTVSARELHEQLHIETPFKKWIDRMCDYGFEESKEESKQAGYCSI